MIKLSRQQVQALAEKIANEINNETAKKNKEIIIKRDALYDKKISLKENKFLKDFLNYHETKNTYAAKNLIHSYIKDKYTMEFEKLEKESQARAYSNDIRNEIILETIQCENLDEIIKKIKAKYQ